MKKNTRVLITTLALIAVLSKPAFAAPTSGQVTSQGQQLQDTSNLLKEAEERRFQLDQKIENLDMHIEEALAQIEENNKQLDIIKKESLVTEDSLKQLEKELDQEQQLFDKRMRAMYISGIDAYIDILFDSKGLDDFLSRISTLKSIIKYNKEMTSSVKLKQEDLNIKKLNLNEQNTRLLALNEETTKKIEHLETSKEEQKKLIEEAKQQESLLAAQEVEDNSLPQIALAAESNPTERPSRGETPASSNAVVEYASKFLGTPYLWGGTTPDGFDCSGFTQYVYRHFGVSLGRTTKQQILNGVGVSKSELQPGDLVFYGQNGVPSHMGIYIGNGKYIHSPQTGEVIKISKYDRADYITARRVLN